MIGQIYGKKITMIVYAELCMRNCGVWCGWDEFAGFRGYVFLGLNKDMQESGRIQLSTFDMQIEVVFWFSFFFIFNSYYYF